MTDPMPHDPLWWRDAVVYQIYPRSFADSNGDGTGDLPGITSHLSHLAELGVDALWISPFFTSPLADAGYDVADYRSVDPVFGTLADFDALLARAQDLGLRVLVDLVPNHSSAQHQWFQAALASAPGSAQRARYIFRDGRDGGRVPPNNWRSVFGGAAWTRVTEADGRPGQWYLHLFDTSQPDFDWTNPAVHAEFLDVLRFWLDRGVAGFRVDVAHGLIKADGLPDTTEVQTVLGLDTRADDHLEPEPTQHTPFWDQDGVHEIYRSWRALLDGYPAPARILCAEAWVTPPQRLANYLRPDEMHHAFAFDLLQAAWQARAVRRAIDASVQTVAEVGAPCTWVLSNHDVVRHATRLDVQTESGSLPHGIRAADPQPDAARGLARARAMTALALALPGAAYLYQGEELGLPEHTTLPDRYRQDPVFARTGGAEAGRDGCRVPLPWAADLPAYGFSSTGRSWLPQPESFAAYAVDRQVGVPGSTLELYRSLLAIRRERGLGRGELVWESRRKAKDLLVLRNGTVRVWVNFGDHPISLPGERVLVASGGLGEFGEVLPPDTAVWLAAD